LVQEDKDILKKFTHFLHLFKKLLANTQWFPQILAKHMLKDEKTKGGTWLEIKCKSLQFERKEGQVFKE